MTYRPHVLAAGLAAAVPSVAGCRSVCVPLEPGTAGEACEAIDGCGPGLACVQSDLWEQCDSQDGGCCLPYCNTESPQCPQGLDCVSWWTDVQGDPMVPYHEHFGLCVGELP